MDHGSAFRHLRYLLLQVRNPEDPIRESEFLCFCRVLDAEREQIRVIDLLNHCPSVAELNQFDAVLIGGSGDYSVAEPGPWIRPALDAMRELHMTSKPTFATCWGFQAMALALGGVVVKDRSRGELGTNPITLTDAGAQDAVFSILPDPVEVQMGHEDIVDELPDGAVLLASSERVTNQAFTFAGKPIYCTQFHPELALANLINRVRHYSHYAERLLGLPIDVVERSMRETPESAQLIPRFVEVVFG